MGCGQSKEKYSPVVENPRPVVEPPRPVLEIPKAQNPVYVIITDTLPTQANVVHSTNYPIAQPAEVKKVDENFFGTVPKTDHVDLVTV